MDIETQVKNKGGSVQYIAGNKWLCLKEMKVPKIGISGYTFIHNVHSAGHCVAILPFVEDAGGRFLLREEIVPPWGLTPSRCSITGAWDDQTESFSETASRELYEESGYKANPGGLISLGTCRGTKATDTIFHLYAINVAGLDLSDAPGDGSPLETKASTVWCKPEEAVQCADPLVALMIMRLRAVYYFPGR